MASGGAELHGVYNLSNDGGRALLQGALAAQVHPECLSNDAANPLSQIGFAMISQKPKRTATSAMPNHSRGLMLPSDFLQA
jgi:hypothetical protein